MPQHHELMNAALGVHSTPIPMTNSPHSSLNKGEFNIQIPNQISFGEQLASDPNYKSYLNAGGKRSLSLTVENESSFRRSLFQPQTRATLDTTGLTSYERPAGVIELGLQRPVVADLCNQVTTTANSIRYVKEDSLPSADGSLATAQGAQKSEASFDISEDDAHIEKLAVISQPITDELLADFVQVRTYIDSRLRQMILLEEENQILNGNGTPPSLDGILSASGLQTSEDGSTDPFGAIMRAATKCRMSGYNPSAVVLNPNDYTFLRTQRDNGGVGAYFGGGPFAYGPYGAAGFQMQPSIWNLLPVLTTSIAEGTTLVGDFMAGCTIFRRSGLQIELSSNVGTDWSKNLSRIRCEERLATAIFAPLAFCVVEDVAGGS